MEVKNCRDCGKLFNYLGGPRVCLDCKKLIEDKFDEVKKFIFDNPRATIPEISKEMEVSIPQINQWIREERLLFAEDSMVMIDCESCGAAIRTGRFCEKCKNGMANDLGNMYKEKKQETRKVEKDRERMRFLDK